MDILIKDQVRELRDTEAWQLMIQKLEDMSIHHKANVVTHAILGKEYEKILIAAATANGIDMAINALKGK